MSVDLVARHVVLGNVDPSRHAALMELCNSLSGKLRNHFLLKISEACLDKYPIMMTDYLSPTNDATKIPMKITIRKDLYPRLYARYKELPQGIRSTVLMNLLNRYAELMAGAPEVVDESVRRMDALPDEQLQGDQTRALMALLGQYMPGIMDEAVRKMTVPGDLGGQGSQLSAESLQTVNHAQGSIKPTLEMPESMTIQQKPIEAEQEPVDPLIGMDSGL